MFVFLPGNISKSTYFYCLIDIDRIYSIISIWNIWNFFLSVLLSFVVDIYIYIYTYADPLHMQLWNDV